MKDLYVMNLNLDVQSVRRVKQKIKRRVIKKRLKVASLWEILFYRSDRKNKPTTKLKCIKKSKKIWDGVMMLNQKDKYNKLFKIRKNFKYSYEKLFRKDTNYDYLISINYNTRKTVKGKGVQFFYI